MTTPKPDQSAPEIPSSQFQRLQEFVAGLFWRKHAKEVIKNAKDTSGTLDASLEELLVSFGINKANLLEGSFFTFETEQDVSIVTSFKA